VRPDQIAGDGQPQAAALGVTRPFEALEHLAQLVLPEPRAGVGHPAPHHRAVAEAGPEERRYVDHHLPARRCVPDCVGQQVVQDLADSRRVRPRLGQPRGDRGTKSHVPLPGLRLMPPHHLVHQDAERHRLLLEDQATGLGERQRVQIIDQVTQAAGLLQQRCHVVVVTGMDPVHLSLDLALQHGQRVPQLMGDVGQEAPLVDVPDYGVQIATMIGTTAGRAVVFAGSTVVISIFGLLLMGRSYLWGLALATSLAVTTVVFASLTGTSPAK
jgi:hypothetical protein